MEHPWLLLTKLAEAVGLDFLAHDGIHIMYTWFVMIVLIVAGTIAARGLTLVPSKMQNFFEIIVSGIEEFMVEITGEEGRWLFPLAATIFLYIFVSNVIGIVPGLFPPTADINTPLSVALIVFVFTHFIGVKYHGIKYVKHFMGPVWWLAPLIGLIEIIGHLARVLSLTFRLFGNMMGHEIVLGILFTLAGMFLAPLPIMGLGIFVAFVQAFVFFLLTIIYFSGSMEHAH